MASLQFMLFYCQILVCRLGGFDSLITHLNKFAVLEVQQIGGAANDLIFVVGQLSIGIG